MYIVILGFSCFSVFFFFFVFVFFDFPFKAPGLRLPPQVWLAFCMASISIYCHNNNNKTVVIAVVVGAFGTVKKGMVENIKKVSERATVTEIRKICMLGSARILRKVLSV